jgi:hypothetical protein
MDADEVETQLSQVRGPDRLGRFLTDYADGLCHVDWWRSVARLWTGAESPAGEGDRWQAIWERAKLAPGARESLMDAQERAAYAALPAAVTVHRGFSGDDWRGLNWTLDRPRAAALARRLDDLHGSGSVATATVPREDVIALFLGRGDAEVVVLPDGLTPEIAPAGRAGRTMEVPGRDVTADPLGPDTETPGASGGPPSTSVFSGWPPG